MPFQSGPSAAVKQLIDQMGGAIWSDTTDMAAGGTSTARTQVENYEVPDAARTLLGWRPIEYPTDQAAAESLISVFDIKGSNYKYQPQEVICGNLATSYLLTGGTVHAPSEYYDVFAPLVGGEKIDIGVEPLDAIAGNRRSGVELTFTNVSLRNRIPVIYSECSREVAVSAAGITAGTTLNISRSHKLIEVGGAFTAAGHTVEEEANVTMVMLCTVWDPVQTIKVMFEPAGAGGDETVDECTPHAYLSRRTQRLNFTDTKANIKTDFDLDVAQTNAGQAAHYIRWI